MRAVLVSWNVHGWIGRDARRRPDRTFEVIRRFDADVVALQEVEGSDWEACARAAGYRSIRGHTIGSRFGNVLLLRLPLERVRMLDLSVPGREPRGALDAVVRLGDRSLRVVTTHLGLRIAERREQAARLGRYLESRDGSLPVALLGDLNDWTPWGSQLTPLVRLLGSLSRLPTFPSYRPILPLDRVGCRVPGLTYSVSTFRYRAARQASDHLPLRLELATSSAPEWRGGRLAIRSRRGESRPPPTRGGERG